MKEELKKVVLEDFELYYEVYGNGNTHILCFHGNDGDASNFKFLAKEDRKIISIHLFLHNHSTFSPSRIGPGDVHKEDVEKLLEKILENEKVDKFHWVAYSQGGRFTLTTFPHFANRVNSLSLIAPDGMNKKSFYSWSQRQWWMRMLFRFGKEHPKISMLPVKVLAKVKFIHPKVLEFLEYYSENPDKLSLGYETWSSFRNLQPNYEEIKTALDTNNIDLKVIVGEHDHIITPKSAIHFTKLIERKEALDLRPFGHNVFKPHIEEELLELLKF